ncbi:MAG: histidine phosphatase family protein [Sulfitobacter sp.]
MSALPPLFILRHGETVWNVEGRLQGRFDSELTPRGIAQAHAQHRILSQHDLTGFDAISSPQGRAVATAELALDGLIPDVRVAPALKEIGLGEWAGKSRADVMQMSGARDGFDVYTLAPEGEGFAALQLRCEAFLRALKAPSVLITHGITSRMLRLILLERPLSALRSLEGGQGVVFHIENGVQRRLT